MFDIGPFQGIFKLPDAEHLIGTVTDFPCGNQWWQTSIALTYLSPPFFSLPSAGYMFDLRT